MFIRISNWCMNEHWHVQTLAIASSTAFFMTKCIRPDCTFLGTHKPDCTLLAGGLWPDCTFLCRHRPSCIIEAGRHSKLVDSHRPCRPPILLHFLSRPKKTFLLTWQKKVETKSLECATSLPMMPPRLLHHPGVYLI